eukprot:g6477.t1
MNRKQNHRKNKHKNSARKNKNTESFVEFLKEVGGYSSASQFQKGHHGYATHRLANAKNLGAAGWRQIDHHVYPAGMRQAVADTRVVRGETVGSDHRMVLSAIRVDDFHWFGSRRKRRGNGGVTSLPTKNQTTEQEREKYCSRVVELNKQGKGVQESIAQAAAECFGKVKERKPWLSREFRDLWEVRRDELAAGRKGEAKAILKLMRFVEKRDKEKYLDKVCDEAEEHFEKSGLAPALQSVAKVAGKKKKTRGLELRKPLTHADETAYMAEGKAELHRKFYADVFQGKEPEELPGRPAKPQSEKKNTKTKRRTCGEIPIGIEDKDIDDAIERLKRGKAAGEDGITREHIDLLQGEAKALVYAKVHQYWRDGKLDPGEVDSVIVVLPKPGKDDSQTAGWRPIALLRFFAKIYATILHKKLAEPMDGILAENQNGFRSYRRATDNTLAVRLLTRDRRKQGLQTCAAFVDLQQCFDTVPRSLIGKAMQAYGVPQGLQERFWAFSLFLVFNTN